MAAAALTPELALAYLRELSADVRDGVVLGDGLRVLAGEGPLAPVAREVAAALGAAPASVGRAAGGAVFAVRAEGLSVVLVCGPQAIDGLVLHDLRLVLGDLGATVEDAPATPATAPAELVVRALSAAQRAPGA
jgi:hypothetical protein